MDLCNKRTLLEEQKAAVELHSEADARNSQENDKQPQEEEATAFSLVFAQKEAHSCREAY